MQRAVALGIRAIAITDHDAVSGLAEAAEAARGLDLDVMPGVEITAGCDTLEIHVVGLGICPETPQLRHVLDTLVQGRAARADAILERLDLAGIAVLPENIAARTAGPVGRMHIAQELRAAGHVRTVQEAFDRYLGLGKPGYVPNTRIPCAEAIDAIHAAGGLAFVGHPGLGGVRRILPQLLGLPFDGIEAYHPQHKPARVNEFIELALANELLISGGSDCHGRAKGQRPLMGKVRLPMPRFTAIQQELHSREAHNCGAG